MAWQCLCGGCCCFRAGAYTCRFWARAGHSGPSTLGLQAILGDTASRAHGCHVPVAAHRTVRPQAGGTMQDAHGASGLTEECRAGTVTLAAAGAQLLAFVTATTQESRCKMPFILFVVLLAAPNCHGQHPSAAILCKLPRALTSWRCSPGLLCSKRHRAAVYMRARQGCLCAAKSGGQLCARRLRVPAPPHAALSHRIVDV